MQQTSSILLELELLVSENVWKKNMVYFKLGRKYEKYIILSVTYKLIRKHFRVLPIGVKPMTFRTPVGSVPQNYRRLVGA